MKLQRESKSTLILILALAVLLFPVAARADNTVSWVSGGSSTSVSASSSALSYTSTVVFVTLANGSEKGGTDFGSLSFTTGALLKGSLASGCLISSGGCEFSFADSSFKISGANGGPSYSGSFTGNIWLVGSCAGTSCSYSIESYGGGLAQITGGTTIFGFHTKGPFTGTPITTLHAGGFTQATVPEPGTLGLLGTGLFGLAGVLRRKLVSS